MLFHQLLAILIAQAIVLLCPCPLDRGHPTLQSARSAVSEQLCLEFVVREW